VPHLGRTVGERAGRKGSQQRHLGEESQVGSRNGTKFHALIFATGF